MSPTRLHQRVVEPGGKGAPGERAEYRHPAVRPVGVGAQRQHGEDEARAEVAPG